VPFTSIAAGLSRKQMMPACVSITSVAAVVYILSISLSCFAWPGCVKYRETRSISCDVSMCNMRMLGDDGSPLLVQ
jgi:hypothetical protein